MKYILPLFLSLILFATSCKKKDNPVDEITPTESGRPPANPKILSIEKDGNDVIITFIGKLTTVYFDRYRPSGNMRYIWNIKYDKLELKSVFGDTAYEFKRTDPYTYTFKHSTLSDDETNGFGIDDWSGYYGKATIDYKLYDKKLLTK